MNRSARSGRSGGAAGGGPAGGRPDGTRIALAVAVAGQRVSMGEFDEVRFWANWLRDHDLFLRMCTRWLGGRSHDAEDIVSRGALKARDYLGRNGAWIERFRPWALRLLHNMCVDSFRGRDRDREAALPSDLGSPVDLPEQVLLSRELASALTGAVESLPERLHAAFRLRVIDEMSYEEVSRRLAITQDNARKRIQQARQMLRERLDVYAD